MNEEILGFQLRLLPSRIPSWDNERRITFLLREQVATPLSVDEAVWPILDDANERTRVFLDPEEPINGLKLHALRREARPNAGSLVAITSTPLVAAVVREKHRIAPLPRASENLKDLGFHRLGFDVADEYFYSALFNCGFGSEKGDLAKRFGSILNEHGLFDFPGDATAYSERADARVRDHAPFRVFGIWQEVGR